VSKSLYIIVDVRDYKDGRGIHEGESVIIRMVGLFFFGGGGYTAGWT